MKSRTLPLFLAFFVLVCGRFTAVAQDASAAKPATNSTAPRMAPKPTNLQVLPKDMTGEKVMDVMHGWENQLGVNCGYCHTRDEAASAKAGRTRYSFADDSKEEKKTARLMLSMTEELNKKYLAQISQEPETLTCGTCHRGHGHPEAFVPAPEHHEGAPMKESK